MKSKVKDHQSDDEDDAIVETHDRPLTKEEIERRQLEHAPVIADSEISPAAYLFQNQEEQEDLNLFEQE